MANILIVDDEPNIIKLTGFIIKSMGHTIFTASNGKEAVSQIKKTPDIDLIITDFIMPEMDGLELAENFSGKYKMIIASATGNELKQKIKEKKIKLDFIEKPFDIENLKKMIENVLKK